MTRKKASHQKETKKKANAQKLQKALREKKNKQLEYI